MPLSRRQFLKSGLTAVAAMLGAVIVQWPQQESASGQSKPGQERFKHRGRDVKIDETERDLSLMIDGVHQHHVTKKVPPKGRPFYVSHLLPFENFSNPAQMARAMIDAEMDLELFQLT